MIPTTMIDKKLPFNSHKKWLMVTLAAAALTLSACGKKEEPVAEGEPAVDAQTQVEQEATGVATANDNVAVASADTNDGMATADGANDDVAVATADDTEVMDGTETEEHISTY